jgi:hypothetical protein
VIILEITVEQQPFKWKLTYKFIESNDTIMAKANKGTFPTKRKVVLYENEQIIIEAIERNLMKVWLNFIPIVNWFIKDDFEIHINGSVGEIKNEPKLKQRRILSTIYGSRYVIYEHTGGLKGDSYSVYQDDEQIGLVSKNIEVVWGAQTYKGLFHDDTNASINRFIMVFIDVFWNGNEGVGTQTARSKEYSWGWDRKFGKPLNENWKVNERILTKKSLR